MKAFVSLHTAKPVSQSDNEVCYPGYKRTEIDFTPDIGNPPLLVSFPEVLATTEGQITHICIGAAAQGDGTMGPVIHSMPYQTMEKGYVPEVTIANIVANKDGEAVGYGLPTTVPRIAQVLYYLIMAGELKAEDLHPRVYEAMNDELEKVGVAVVPVTRAGRGDLVSTGWSLGELGEAIGSSIH